MLMMFGAALRKAPFERAFPFDKSDIMILINDKYGMRLRGICDETGNMFSIIDFMLDKPDVFGKDVKERVEDFADIFSGRVERFFISKKSSYIFFDLEEQKFLRKLMTKQGLSCSIELYKYSENEPPYIIDLEDIPKHDIQGVLHFMKFCNVRVVTEVDRYYLLISKAKTHKFNYNKPKKQDGNINEMFEKYSKLSSLDSKTRVDKYFKLLLKKYHPDNNQENQEAEEIFREINQDSEDIKATLWYKNLKE